MKNCSSAKRNAPPAIQRRFISTTRCTTLPRVRRRFLKNEAGDGPIKAFTLRGIKESPPYFHDGRLLTLEDTVEFFNLVLELKLTPEEKHNLVEFMRQL